jgi:hypothetical protein
MSATLFVAAVLLTLAGRLVLLRGRLFLLGPALTAGRIRVRRRRWTTCLLASPSIPAHRNGDGCEPPNRDPARNHH